MTDLNKIIKELIDEIDNISEETQVAYEVWAMGYDEHGSVTDTEILLKTFIEPEDAVTYAKNITLADIVFQTADDNNREANPDIFYISVEVETVVATDDDGLINAGTIFKKDIWITEECSEETDLEIVELAETDYSLRSDGSIRVSCELLKNFNKNDYVQFKFISEATKPILTYKIISKNTGNQYICEFIY